MLYTAAVTLCALLISVILALAGRETPAAVAHLAFAVGIVPLIFAAITHFVPVLTRTGDAPRGPFRFLSVAAQLAGLLAVVALAGWGPRWLLHPAALIDFVLAGVLLSWIAGRVRRCLGAPHPGWRWYAAALGCLMLALAVVPFLAVPSGRFVALRNFHLHLNTLGLVGLAALGTLPVLLPTALGRVDPEAAGWLRRRLWPVAGGAMSIAIGAAFSWALAVVGAALLCVVALGLVGQWGRRFGRRALGQDGAGASLLAAVGGFLVVVVAGVAHGTGLGLGRSAIAAWAAGFLLPLVTGALSHLLPVWRWPGPGSPARQAMRTRLVAAGQVRALCFLGAGLALAGGQSALGGALTGSAMSLFLFAVVRAMGVPAPAR